MWAQVSSGLKGEFDDDIIPEEIQETIRETRETVTEVQKTLEEVTEVATADLNDTISAVSDIKASVEADIADTKATVAEIKASIDADIEETKATVAEIETSLEDVKSTVETSFGEIPKAIEAVTTASPPQTVPISQEEVTALPNIDSAKQQAEPVTEVGLSDSTLPITDGEKAQAAETTIAGEDA